MTTDPQTRAAARPPASRIWLASGSARRRELLAQIGVAFDLLLPEDREAAERLENVRPNEPPDQYVARVALAKLALAMDRRQREGLVDRPILAADTTVAKGGRILGKPVDAADAKRMLRLLSGDTHRVLSAVAVARGNRIRHRVQVSRVWFARLSDAAIDSYVATGDCFDKAGGYGIQGEAARFVRRIEGSYTGIMGLPLHETSRLLGL